MPFTQPEPENDQLNSNEAGRHDNSGASVSVVVSEPETARHKNPISSLRSRARERRHARRRAAVTLLRSLTAVLVGSLILRLASLMMGSMLQSYFKHIGVSYTVMGFLLAAFFMAELVGAPVFGALSDRYGRKRFILLGPVLGAVAVQATSVTTAIWLLFITRLLEGLSTASSIPATLGYISEATSGRPRLRARVIGLFEITFVGGMAFGVALGGYIWDFFGEEATVFGLHFTSPAFSINGLIYLVSLAVFAWGLKDVNGGAHTPEEMSEYKKWSHYRVILRSRRVWLLVPAWLAINSIIGMWFNFSIRVLTDKERSLPFAGQFLMGHWSGTERDVYVGFGVFLVIFASGVLAWSFILGRYRKTSVMLVATGGLAVILPAIYLMNHHHSFSGATFYLLVAMLAIAVLVMSGFAPAALTYLADVTEAHAEDRGSIMGLYSVFLGVGQFIGTATGGLFANWKGIDGLLLLSAIFGTITTLTLISLHRRNSLATA